MHVNPVSDWVIYEIKNMKWGISWRFAGKLEDIEYASQTFKDCTGVAKSVGLKVISWERHYEGRGLNI